MTMQTQQPKFHFDDVVRCTVDQQVFTVVNVLKVNGAFFYSRNGLLIPESKLVRHLCIASQEPKTQSCHKAICVPGKKLFAYRNHRTTRITHYEFEWSGNQFSKRAPEFDTEKV